MNFQKYLKKRNFLKGQVHGSCQKIELFSMSAFWANQGRKDRFLLFWIEKNTF